MPQKLHHVMFETNERDDVGAAFDRVWATDLAIPNGLGRHDNDGMFSFYVVSPAGFQVEVGHGARGRHRRGTTTVATTASAGGVTSRCGSVRDDDVTPTPTSRSSATGRSARAPRSCSASSDGRVVVLERWPEPVSAARAPCTSTTRSGASSSRVASARSCGASASPPTSTSGATRRVRHCFASGAWATDRRDGRCRRCSASPRSRRSSTGGRRRCRQSRYAAVSRSRRSSRAKTASRCASPTATTSGRATSSGATARTAPSVTSSALPVDDLGFFYDWLVVDVILDEPRVFDPLNVQICDPRARPRLCRADRADAGGNSCACPHESLDELNDEAPAWELLEPGTCTRAMPVSNGTRSTRSTPDTPSSWRAGACSSPATRRT